MINPTDSTWSMPSPSDTNDEQSRLAEILDTYLQSLEDGIPIDPELLISQHPDLEQQLREYMDGIALLNDGIGEFRNTDVPLKHRPAKEEPRVLGDYEIVKEIGRGGMGVVYEARQISLDRQVALKVLPFASMLDHKQVVRFQNEARAAAQLHHPNIVPIHGVGRERGVNYFAMQFISGHSLRTVIDDYRDRFVETEEDSESESTEDDTIRNSTSDSASTVTATAVSHRHPSYIQTVVSQAVQAANALAAAHECGVIHRDVKPSNLILDEDGKLWVTDFGLARIQSDNSFTQSGDILGTLNYMSPEQASGDNALTDHRTDIYSLGVTLYELLTLHRAFQGQNHADVTSRINSGNFKRLRSWNNVIPHDLENVVLKAMATSRDERYLSAHEMAEDLTRFLNGIPTRAKKPTALKRLAKWTKRRRRTVAAICAIALLATTGIAISSVRFARERSNSLQVLSNMDEAKEAVYDVAVRAARRLGSVPGTEQVRASILSDALSHQEKYLSFAKEFDYAGLGVAETHAEMALLYSLGGKRSQAVAECETAERIVAELPPKISSSYDAAVVLTRVLNSRGLLQRELGNLKKARLAFESAIDRLESLDLNSLEKRQQNFIWHELATSWNNLGLLNADEGFSGDAESAYRSAKKTLDKIDDAADAQTAMTRASVFNNLSQLLVVDKQQAISWAVKAIETLESLDAIGSSIQTSELANYYNNVASLYAEAGDSPKAASNFREAIRLQNELQKREPYVSDHKRDLAVTLNNQGLLQFQEGRHDESRRSFESALRLQSDLVEQFPMNVRYANQMGGICNNLAMVYSRQNRPDSAERAYEQAINYLTIAHEESPSFNQFRNHLSRSLFNFCDILLKNGKTEKAIESAIRRREMTNNGNQLFSVAVDLVRAYQQFQVRPPTDRVLVTNLVNEIENTLEQAVAAGWQVDTSNLVYETFKENPKLARFFSGPDAYKQHE